MSDMSLEWSSAAGSAALTLLAGPWRRGDAPTGACELFHVRVPIDLADAPKITAAVPPVLASASERLIAALRRDDPLVGLPRAEAGLRQALAGSGLAALADVTPALLDLSRRATAPARVETRLGEHVCIVTDLPVSGSSSTYVLPGTPAAIVTLHHEAVAAAATTRVALLRAAITTTELAAIVAAFAPALVLLALPLAWRFLHDLLAEPTTSSGD